MLKVPFNSESNGVVRIEFLQRGTEISGMTIYRDLPPDKFHAQYLGSPLKKINSDNAIRFRIDKYLQDGLAEQISQVSKKVNFAPILSHTNRLSNQSSQSTIDPYGKQ